MRKANGRKRSVAVVAALVALAGAAGAVEREGRKGAGEEETRLTRAEVRGARILEVLAYQVAGVRDSATAATVVHCTNLGAADRTAYVDIYAFDGTFDCTVSSVIGAGATATYATRETALYFEDDSCEVAPESEQGSIDIYVTTSNTLMCTVQVLDPAAATPVYVTTLDLFRR